MKIIKKWMVGLFLFLAALTGMAQSHVPTLQSNNNWLGNNNFLAGKLSYGTLDQSCPGGQVQAGYHAADFSPICISFSAVAGVSSLNGLTGGLTITNPDGNLNVAISGTNTIQINCPGCGGSGGTPAGGTGAIQWYGAGGHFAGTIISGMVKSLGAAGPAQALGDTDFQLPITLNCTGSINCPKTGDTWAFSLSGSAGSGNVDNGNFGQLGGYINSGGSTTIQGFPNIYALNVNWSAAQMNALFNRFNGSPVTSWSGNGSVLTLQAVNSFTVGEHPALQGFTASGSSCFNNSFVTVLSAGLSNTQFEVSAACSGTGTETTAAANLQVPAVGNFSNGVVLLPPGLVDNPSQQFVNLGNAQVMDSRKGYWDQQASAYGVQCGVTSINVTLTNGSNQAVVGSSFGSVNPTGMTMVAALQSGYSNTGVQTSWTPIVSSYNIGTLTVTLSSNSPLPTGSYPVLFGMNNQAALQRAFNDVGGSIPLWMPTCPMLTDTVRWNGTSLIGKQMNFTSLSGFPAHDILQQQDGLPIVAWSINASTGVTTFTVPAYAAHSILAASDYYIPAGQPALSGDLIQLKNFPTATFFNNVELNIATHPTPTTFTVNSAFGQSTSSGTDQGLAAPTNGANVNAMRVEHITFSPSQYLDGSYQWNQYDQNAVLTVEPGYYRPLLATSVPANNPFGPGWGSGQVNGVATITQNSAVVCSPSTGRIPAVGTIFVLPYQTGGLFSTTVSSTAGSCSGGFTARTLASALPNTSGYTATQAEWFTYSGVPQSLAIAMPATITLPYTMYLNVPTPPVASTESDLAPHGHIRIGNDEWDYMGIQFGGTASTNYVVTSVANASGGSTVYTGSFTGLVCTSSPVVNIAGFSNAANNGSYVCTASTGTTATLSNPSGVAQTQTSALSNPAPYIVLRNGPTSTGGGSGHAVNSVIFPLNPCQLMYHNPYPVVPTINASNATPVNATYYAGICGGNAGMAFPAADAQAYTSFGNGGMSLAFFNNVSYSPYGNNAAGNQNANGTMGVYEAGNYTGYGNTFANMRFNQVWGAFMQGPASVNQSGVSIVGPTSTGQSFTNCTVRSGYGFALINMQQSNIDRCDTYSTEVSQYDGLIVGASTGLYLSYTLNEQTGGGVTGMSQFTVKDYNNEPENGTHEEFMPSVVSDGNNITWLGTIFEGGYNVFGGSFQQFHGTQMAVPIFNYGTNNYFDKLFGVTVAYNDLNVYNGIGAMYNWGNNSTCQAQSGVQSPLHGCGPNFLQDYNGHDMWSLVNGDPNNPTYNVLGGLITPIELGAGDYTIAFDPTETFFGQHLECNVGTGLECVFNSFDGISGGILIGNQQRVTAGKVVVKMNVRAKNSGTFTFRLLATAQNLLSLSSCTPNFNLSAQTFTVTSANWTSIALPIDYTPYASCSFALQADQGSATNVLEIGYTGVIPFPGQMYGPLKTPTSGAVCPVSGEFAFDSTHMWVCAPSSGVTYGAGTWKSTPIS